MSGSLQVERRNRLLHIILNRPERRNALNAELCSDLSAALDHAEDDRGVHAILLSAGGPAFCAGMDLTEVLEPPPHLGVIHEQLFTAGARLTKPVIAAVHGPALGGGVGLVANAHAAVAAPGVTFALTEIRLGLWPFLIFRSVAQAVGERRAVELCLTGRVFDAAEAREIGLVHHIAEDPLARALELAESIADFSNTAVRSGLRFVSDVRGRSAAEGAQMARQIREQVFRTPEFRQSVRDFLDRKK
jgi:methylglutaconyl-CoA hydratase